MKLISLILLLSVLKTTKPENLHDKDQEYFLPYKIFSNHARLDMLLFYSSTDNPFVPSEVCEGGFQLKMAYLLGTKGEEDENQLSIVQAFKRLVNFCPLDSDQEKYFVKIFFTNVSGDKIKARLMLEKLNGVREYPAKVVYNITELHDGYQEVKLETSEDLDNLQNILTIIDMASGRLPYPQDYNEVFKPSKPLDTESTKETPSVESKESSQSKEPQEPSKEQTDSEENKKVKKEKIEESDEDNADEEDEEGEDNASEEEITTTQTKPKKPRLKKIPKKLSPPKLKSKGKGKEKKKEPKKRRKIVEEREEDEEGFGNGEMVSEERTKRKAVKGKGGKRKKKDKGGLGGAFKKDKKRKKGGRKKKRKRKRHVEEMDM